MNNAKRIMVSGCSGSGKSTLVRQLAQRLDLPPVHMDIHYWHPGWVPTPEDEWRVKLQSLVGQDRWVLDGSFPGTMDISLPRAQILVVLQLPRLLCLYRALSRIFKYNHITRRPDMAEGCDEKFDFSFYKYIWDYNRIQLPLLEEKIETHGSHLKVVRLKSRAEVTAFLDEVCAYERS